MKAWKRWAVGAAMTAVAAGAEGGAASGETYVVESRILSAPASVVKGWEEPADGRTRTLEADSLRIWTTNTVEEAMRILAAGKAGDPAKHIDILSAPRMVVLAARPASISIASTMQYMEPAGNGLWRVRETDPDDSPGVFVDATVRTARQDGAAEVDVALRVVIASGRKTVEGLSLDVGRPVLSTRKIETRVTTKPGEWIAAGGCDYDRSEGRAGRVAKPAGAEPHRLLFLVRVTKGAGEAP